MKYSKEDLQKSRMDGPSVKLVCLMLVNVVMGNEENWEELFSIENKINLELNVYSEIPGNILWTPTNTTVIKAKAKIYETDFEMAFEDRRLPLTACNINTDIKDDSINVQIFPRIKQTFSNNYQNNGGFHLLYSYVLMLCIMTSVHGWRVAVTYGLLLSTMFTFVDMCLSNITKIDIIIEYPEKVHFRKITLYMKDGNVTSLPDTVSIDSPVNCATYHTPNDTGCLSCCHGNGFCGIGNKCYCKKGYDEKTHCKMKIIPRHTIYINPVDRRIAHLQVPNNLNITAYGRRYTNGSIKSLKSFQSRDQYGRSLSILMGRLRKVSNVVSSSGTSISFDWRNKCNVHVAVLFNKGQGQIDQDVTLCRSNPKKKPVVKEDNKALNLLPSRKMSEKQSRSRRKLSHYNDQDVIKIPVEVKSCNEPDSSAVVSATVVSTNTSYTSNEYVGLLTGYAGLYHINIPDKPIIFNGNIEKNVCSSFIKTTSHMCKYVLSNYNKFQHHICRNIKSSMNVMKGLSISQIDDVINTCESSFSTVISFCIEYTTSIQYSCNRDNIIFYDSFVPGNISVLITATFPGNYSVYSERFYLKVKENAPFATSTKMINDIRPKPRFIGFSVHPRDPQPFERYRVKIDYACASATTKLDMRIEGSDNYHNNVTCIGVTSCNCCVLHVAGASALVMDKVLVSLNDPLTQTVTTREIAVLF